MKNNSIRIISQAFYGNRTATEVSKENIDRFILGVLEEGISIEKPIDRTIVKIPNTENLVIVYNKFEEENRSDKSKPLAIIPEENLEVYSRCIVCRISDDGELESLERGDYEKFVKYLAE